jgi:hypothetical protein
MYEGRADVVIAKHENAAVFAADHNDGLVNKRETDLSQLNPMQINCTWYA